MSTLRRICVLTYDGMTLLDVAGPVEVLNEADGGNERYTISLLGQGSAGFVRTSSGIRLAVDEPDENQRYDTLIIPGADGQPPLTPELVEQVQLLRSRSRRVASICTGSFLLAEAGLLDGLSATTHWRYVDLLRRRYPGVQVERDALFVRAGDTYTSAGVSSGIDLALALVEDDYGPELARDVARLLVVFLHRHGGQSQFSARARLPALRSSSLRPVLDAITADPTVEHTLTSMAQIAGLSARHLSRLFQSELGMTPARFLEVTRIEAAQELLVAGATVTAAAQGSGFGNDLALRRSFMRQLGISPKTYRARFTSTPS